MARATFVKAAAKDYPTQGIAKGESYYWWKFKNGSKQYSKVAPRASQLTQSAYYAAAYEIQESIENLSADDSLPSDVADIVSTLRDLAEEQDDKFNNMPDSLQQGEIGQLLEQRRDSCNEYADELEGLDLDEFRADPLNDDECDACEGTGKIEDDECAQCGGTGRTELDDPLNDDGETEQEYWDAKVQEVQDCSFNIE